MEKGMQLELQKRYEELVNNVNIGIYRNTPGPEGFFLEVNPAMLKIFEADSKEELLKHSVNELYQDPDQRESISDKLLKDGFINHEEISLVTLRGRKIVASVTAVMRKGKKGDIYFDGIVEDVTEQKNAQEKLKAANREWQNTFDSISDILFIQDSHNNIIKANKAFLDVVGKKPQDVIGRKCFEILHNSDKPIEDCPFEKTKKDDKPHIAEIYHSNIRLPLLVTNSPLFDDNGNLIGSVHIAKDVTDLKKANDDIKKANDELKKLDQLKSDFVATVSHELRTPLSIMKEGISLLLDGVAGTVSEPQIKIMNAVSSNINRLTSIVDDLLDISKIEAGKIRLKKKLVDVADVVKESCENWKVEANKKQQEIRFILPPSPVDIYIDVDRIKQVINNLISNAIKYTPQDGKIEVELKTTQDHIEVCISDNGIGIAEEDLPRVFNKFQQFNRKAGPGQKGTGLGLAIVKELVEMHKGAVKVESKLDHGSRFSFSIPRLDSEAVFGEYIYNAISDVLHTNTHLSLITIKILEAEKIKDTLGYKAYNGLLVDIENLISGSIHRNTDIVLRSMQELLILLYDTQKKNVGIVEGRVQGLIKDLLSPYCGKLPMPLRLAFGNATYPDDTVEANVLLEKARESPRILDMV